MVKVYTKPGCMQCRMTADLLTKRGVQFEYIDISKDVNAASRVTELGFRQLPVVEDGETNWSGFRPDLVQRITTSAAAHS